MNLPPTFLWKWLQFLQIIWFTFCKTVSETTNGLKLLAILFMCCCWIKKPKFNDVFFHHSFIQFCTFVRATKIVTWQVCHQAYLPSWWLWKKKEYGSLFSLEAFEFCGSSLPDEHNTLPKSTRRNVKLNKFAFGIQWLYQIYYVNIIYVISMKFLSLHCRRSSLQNIASSEEWGEMAVFIG